MKKARKYALHKSFSLYLIRVFHWSDSIVHLFFAHSLWIFCVRSHLFYVVWSVQEHAHRVSEHWSGWIGKNANDKIIIKKSMEETWNEIECQLSNISTETATTKLKQKIEFDAFYSSLIFSIFVVYRNDISNKQAALLLHISLLLSLHIWIRLQVRSFAHWMYLLQCFTLKAKPDSR